MYNRTILLEYKNCEPFYYVLESKEPINIERAASFFEEHEGFNEERDSIRFIDEATTINLDKGSIDD